MPRSILVGLDGSPSSTAAVELGIQWAREFGALLVGLAIVDEPTICEPQSVSIGGMAFKEQRDQALMADARRKVKAFLEEFTSRCSNAGVASKALEDVGLPADQIMLEAQRYDLILLGQQTHFHFETQSQADDMLRLVVKNSPRPVVAVPEKLPIGTGIVVAYDGRLQAARTLQAFQAMGLAGSQPVHIVCVHTDHAEAMRRADRAAEFLRFHQIVAQPLALATAESPARVILEQVNRLNAGLLVMGAYGQPMMKEFFLGSETKTVLQESTVPLFLSR